MKKKIRLLWGLLAALILAIAIAIVLVLNPIKSDEAKVTDKVKTIGSTFYEDFFYPQQVLGLSEAEIAQKLTVFSDDGISITLESIEKVLEIKDKVGDAISEVTSESAKLVCNPQTTKVIIIPKEPFTKHDYDVKVELDCK
ncbi:hypothetical protein AOC36_02120 [Erysipelothrix larvae]|uniref:Uncharacterized protein n=1 Tax=Erysipelothrix larvae TaxID=1514105 RepID=A0A109UGL3_9FIRM|nr:hypothetical protein [Erysipelothrix larvae]AMC92822.1 hypothetical protein AOC36_02120 [Erysipelothrix larvae]